MSPISARQITHENSRRARRVRRLLCRHSEHCGLNDPGSCSLLFGSDVQAIQDFRDTLGGQLTDPLIDDELPVRRHRFRRPTRAGRFWPQLEPHHPRLGMSPTVGDPRGRVSPRHTAVHRGGSQLQWTGRHPPKSATSSAELRFRTRISSHSASREPRTHDSRRASGVARRPSGGSFDSIQTWICAPSRSCPARYASTSARWRR